MAERKKLLNVLSAIIVGAGTAATVSATAAAAVTTAESAIASIRAADPNQSAVTVGNEAELRSILQDNPTSQKASLALDGLIQLAAAGNHGSDARGDNGQNGISNSNEHGRMGPNRANPERANERATDPSIY